MVGNLVVGLGLGVIALDEPDAELNQIVDGLGAGNEVERRRQRAAAPDVLHVELGARELPLDIGLVLFEMCLSRTAPKK